MKPLPEDDPRLSAFLKAHRPPIPPADPALEERLLAAIATTPQEIATIDPSPGPRSRGGRRNPWLLPGAIAAGLVVAIVGYHTRPQVQPTASAPSAAELAELENFIENTWQDPVAEQPAVYADELLNQADVAAVDPTIN